MAFKNVENGYIWGVCEKTGAIEITESEYTSILQKIQNKPGDPGGYQYRLRADTLEWELVELPPMPSEDDTEVTAADYEAALREVGVDV